MIPLKKILILGSSSWLGSILLNKLDTTEYDVKATVFNTYLSFNSNIKLVEAKHLGDYKTELNDFNPNIIINFLRGEDDEGYQIHKEIINYCSKQTNSHYIYCSSALALDGHKNVLLTENLLAHSISDYGIFKANCERVLYDSSIDWTILRFSSLQGYCEHKQVRNEHFLNKLCSGEVVKVDGGIYQNRMFVDDAIDLILKIIQIKQTGIIHLGTRDSSDEIDFLRKQAILFGYSPDQVLSNNTVRNVNLNCIPNTIHLLDKRTMLFYEIDTLNKINAIAEYNKYRKNEC